MDRNQGVLDSRVSVAVSEPMANLRSIQGMLNGFWQSSELANGFFLSHEDTLFADKQRPTVELLGFIESTVWFPNNQGRIKHDINIGSTLDQVRNNTVYAYRASLLSFYSAFEAYLDERVDHDGENKHWKWGPFVKTLAVESLIFSEYPVSLKSILCADLIRVIRNKMIHKAFWVPETVEDPVVAQWKDDSKKKALIAKEKLLGNKPMEWADGELEKKLKDWWTEDKINENIEYAASRIITDAINFVNKAAHRNEKLPIEYFYMLFTFTNLDSLAFEIEEALLPPNARTGYFVKRKKAAIQRSDLIIA